MSRISCNITYSYIFRSHSKSKIGAVGMENGMNSSPSHTRQSSSASLLSRYIRIPYSIDIGSMINSIFRVKAENNSRVERNG